MTNYSGLVLLPGADTRWMRFCDGEMIEEGTGFPTPLENEDVAALYPATDTTILSEFGGDLPRAQAVAVAQRMAKDTLLTPIDELHFAAGSCVAVVDRAGFASWLAELKSAGLDPCPVVPAQLVPVLSEGVLTRAKVGPEIVLRGAGVSCAWDAHFGDFLTTDQAVVDIAEPLVPSIISEAVVRAEVDLRQGPFATQKLWAGGSSFLRLCAGLAAATLLVTLLTPLVLATRTFQSADEINRSADDLARSVLAKDVSDPQAALDAKMSQIRGPGKGFGPTSVAVFTALKSVAGSSLSALSFDARGAALVTVQARSEADIGRIRDKIAAQGFRAEQGPVNTTNNVWQTEYKVVAE